MPVGYHINPDEGLITVRADGSMDADRLRELGSSLLADERYDPTLPQLVDIRGLRLGDDPDLSGFNEFVQTHYRERVSSSVAVVIDDHLEQRHCADIYLVTCAIEQAELFADYDQALRWLMRRAFATAGAVSRPRSLLPGSADHEDPAGDESYHPPE